MTSGENTTGQLLPQGGETRIPAGPGKSREKRLRTACADAKEPFRFHPPEIRPAVRVQRFLGIEDVAAGFIADKHDPMPGRPGWLAMPLDREQRAIRQPIPRSEWTLLSRRETKTRQQTPHVPRIMPKPGIGYHDAELRRRSFHRGVIPPGQRRDTGDAATGAVLLDDRLHDGSITSFSSPANKSAAARSR